MLEFSLKLRLYLSLLYVVGTALVKIENWISLFIYI
ncbi:MAG: energy-coupling factor transporter transmembrane protein EcfT, partial [Spirochaetia bacterium]|nr:energy-coupling factor transporter transmembrane protein EcfT [Spirochaetia bacterium]